MVFGILTKEGEQNMKTNFARGPKYHILGSEWSFKTDNNVQTCQLLGQLSIGTLYTQCVFRQIIMQIWNWDMQEESEGQTPGEGHLPLQSQTPQENPSAVIKKRDHILKEQRTLCLPKARTRYSQHVLQEQRVKLVLSLFSSTPFLQCCRLQCGLHAAWETAENRHRKKQLRLKRCGHSEIKAFRRIL